MVDYEKSSHSVNIICEESVRYSFVSHLSAAFRRKGISVFVFADANLDYRNQGARVSVVVFSETYAFSLPWDDNFAKVFDLGRKNNHEVIPVFYGVDPSVVNQEWLGLLLKTGSSAGHQSRNSSNMICSDSILVEDIVGDVYRRLSSTERVGVYSRILEIENLLCEQPWDVRSLGIWGMPGIGKTTLAKAVFDHMSNDYDASCFIDDFDEQLRKEGPHRLLEEKIGKILKEKFGVSSSYMSRLSLLKNKLCDTRILVILDDVRNPLVAESFLRSLDWFGPGSLIIVTSRYKQVFSLCQISQTYEVQGLNKNEALQLFSRIAFEKDVPDQNDKELSMKVIDYANGNPLALCIYGRELKGKKPEMEAAFLELKQSPPQMIQDGLKSVYSELGDNEKYIFLNIAFFFNGENVDYVVQLLKGCGYFPRVGIDVLVEKCLVTISENTLQMNDRIRDIISGERIQMERCTTLWQPSRIRYLLEDDELKADGEPKETPECVLVAEDIEGISLDISNLTFDVNPDAFRRMVNLKFLKVYNSYSEVVPGLYFPKGLNSLPCELRLLHWANYSLESLPQGFDFRGLVEINMPYSQLKELRARTENLEMLKRVRLCHSWQLVEFSIHKYAQNIELIDVQGCTRLEIFPAMTKLQHLRVLNLSGCSNIKIVPALPPNIEELHLQGTSIEEIPISIVARSSQPNCKELMDHIKHIPGLEHVDLESVTNLINVSSYNQGIGKLIRLNMKDCLQLRSLPDMSNLESLQILDLSGCCHLGEIKGFPGNMKELYIAGTGIQELPEFPKSLEFLNAHGCDLLKSVRYNFEQIPRHYTFSNCFALSLETTVEFLEKGLTRMIRSDQNVKALKPKKKKKRMIRPVRKQNQERIKAPGFNICVPADTCQMASIHWRAHSFVMVELDPRTRNAVTGFAMSVLVSFLDDDHNAVGLGIRCICTWKTKTSHSNRKERVFQCWAPKEAPRVKKDHIFVFYDAEMNPCVGEGRSQNMPVGELKFEFHTVSGENNLLGANCVVTKCDVKVITVSQGNIFEMKNPYIWDNKITTSRDSDDIIGMEACITEINSLLSLQSDEVRIMGIWGPTGIGKTTTARVLYNQLSPGFPFSTFINNIKGSYSRPCYNVYPLKLCLQKMLLSEIFEQQDIVIHHLGVAQEKLRDKKVLVVLDEVDSLWQLNAMADKPDWFGPGSIIIITAEDRKLFKAHGINHIYKMTFPARDEALQIFCLNAFGQKSSYDGFEALAWEVTKLAGHLPLGLKVLGRYLRGLSMDEWIDALPRLRSSLDGELESTLRFSYDVLSDKDKALFLYIACFFNDYEVDCFKRCLANSCLDVNHGFQNLVEKSLISTKYNGKYLEMHCLLQQMGREIVYRESTDKPGKRKFLMDTTEICDLLDENTGSRTVIGIMFKPPAGEEIEITKNAFEGISNLQFLTVYSKSLFLPEGLNYLPNKLRFIHWDKCPMRFWPSKFSGKFLIELIMRESKLEKLWEGVKPLQCLKRMDLSHSKDLKEIPDLSKATNLEELYLHSCSGLLELTNSIGNATKLKRLNLDRCLLLKQLPYSIGNATNLQFLHLSYCSSLEELPSSIGRLINLEELQLSYCEKLVTLPSFDNLHKLLILNMSNCEKLEVFPTNVNLGSLSEISLRACSRLKTFPDISTNIKELDLCGTAIEEVPSSISSWSSLERLDMSECRNLKKFPNVPDSIVELRLSKTGIEEITSWIGNLFRLRELTMDGCKKLKIISPNISKLQNLEFLHLSVGVKGYDDYGNDNDEEDADDNDGDEDDNYSGVFDAVIKWGPDLISSLTLQSDLKVDYILPKCLPEKALTSPISLSFRRYRFKTIPDCIRHLSGLSELDITACTELEALPQLPGSLLSLDAAWCISLRRIDCSFQNPEICLNFANCFDLNEEARELIQTSACKYAILPGVQVPEHFTHQAPSASLTINLSQRPLPSSFKFKACILLSKGNINLEDHSDDDDEEEEEEDDDDDHHDDDHNDDDEEDDCDDDDHFSEFLSCRVRGKQNGLIVRYGSKQLQIRARLGDTEHLYIFEDSFSLRQDCPATKEATLISELVFEFILHNKYKKVKGCGVRLLEVPHSTLGGEQTEDEDCMDRNIEANNETEDGEESGGGDVAETRSRKRMRLSIV